MVLEKWDDSLNNDETIDSEQEYRPRDALAVGVIARSAGLFQNKKKICLCTGKTLWEESSSDLN